MAIPLPQAVTTTQNDWRFCVKCLGLFWNGRADNGWCPHPGAGAHQASSWDFYLPADPSKLLEQPPNLQTGP
jgi:hypothetical protein